VHNAAVTDLCDLDASAQAALVRRGEASPAELVAAAAARIDALDPELHALVHRRPGDLVDAEVGAIDAAAPFAGVPFLAKDAGCSTAGDPYWVGFGRLRDADHRATADSELARRFRAAGFVCLGRTNVPQLCLSATTEPRDFGPTRNPWDTSRSTGGSSGGSAAAVASRMVPVAHGNDAGGSIRIPASHCGLVGLKPTRGRVSDGPQLGETWGGLNHEFVLTRSVRDCASLLDVLAGRAWGDPYSAPPPARPWRDEVGADPGRLRVRVLRSAPDQTTEPDVVAAVDAAGRLLEQLGHDVAEIEVAELTEPLPYGEITAAAAARDLERLAAASGVALDLDDLEPLNQMIVQWGRSLSAADYLAAHEAMHAYGRRLETRWADLDVLVTPTVPRLPARLGELAPDVELATLGARLGARTGLTAPFDITGQPAMSVPLHQTDDGLPVGVQLVAAYGRENLLFRVASQLEAAAPWADRRPPIIT
jgi:amidase